MPSKNGHTSPPYISHVRLKGYKSIIDTKVDLHPGLNIIIGPNGSGKTNFLEFLFTVLQFQYHFLKGDVESVLELNTGKDEFIWKIKLNEVDYNDNTKQLEKEISEWINLKGQSSGPIKLKFPAINNPFNPSNGKSRDLLHKYFYPITYITFVLPNNIMGLDQTLTLSVPKKNLQPEITNKGWLIKFILQFISDNFYQQNFKRVKKITKKTLDKKLFINETLVRNLQKFTPVQDVRVNKNFVLSENLLHYHISYFSFQFLFEGNWLSWDMLSDGTKRLFYIVSEITLNEGICFIEEPEIGVHPDQYRKILNFLKEQSEDKQIIITTHSPRSLDILKDNELNKITLTRFDENLGTKMRHLTNEEIKHAIQYRENDGSTSELWTYTGFFDEEEAI